MIQPVDDRTPPMTPQLALRVAIVGTFALVMFALIFFRLWFLQVLTGSQYAAAAQGNNIQAIPVAAPRGEILASNGAVLVDSQAVPAVEISPQSLPVPVTLTTVQTRPIQEPSKDYVVFNELAKLLGMSTKPRTCTYLIYPGPVSYNPELAPIPCLVAKSVANSSFANATIKTDVSPDIQAYIEERQTEQALRGVVTTQVYVRHYPQDKLAAQVLGSVAPVTTAQLKQKNFKGAAPTDVVGSTGLEYEYNEALMGIDGSDRVKVNSAGEFEGNAKAVSPVPGNNLRTSIDLNLEKVGDRALQEAIDKSPPANSGAFIALDPQNGQIYGMGSLPSYEPSIFTHTITQKELNRLESPAANQPLINRAISSPLPDGSTFKVITATAALESGRWSLGQTYDDTGQFCYPGVSKTLPGDCIHNSGNAAYGTVDLQQAIQVSDDVFFYNLGYQLQFDPTKYPNGGPLQSWARQYGIGQTTGVDLPGESSGVLPTPKYVAGLYQQELECESATGIYAYTNGRGLVSATKLPGYHRSPKQPASKGGCGISNKSVETWTVGDNVESGVGQGDDLVTPIQLAVVYAALANGGKIVTPHLGEDVESSTGTILQKFDPAPKRTLNINPAYRAAILDGLHEAAQSPGGTSDDVMGSFPLPVYGKTGTAQTGTAEQIATNTETDYAWYACFVPATATTKPIVVVVSVEKGGFGDVAAAPVARQILSQWFYGKPGSFTSGSSKDT